MVPAKQAAALILATMALAAAGCGSRPDVARLERARTLVDEAEARDAAKYAAEELARAQEALATAEAEYAEQDKTFALRRSPDPGNALADQAAALADEAVEATNRAFKTAARGAREELSRAETAVVTAEAALANLARCARGSTVTGLRGFGDRLQELRSQLTMAKSHFDEGDYRSTSEVCRRTVTASGVYVNDATHAKHGAGCS